MGRPVPSESGGLAEWSKAPRSKRGKGAIPSEVRILYPPLSDGIEKNRCARESTVGSNLPDLSKSETIGYKSQSSEFVC